MAGHLNPASFYIPSAILFTLAILSAITRTAIRFRHSKLGTDDVFFALAVATLISGTVLIYINVPLAYAQQEVEAGLRTPPEGFLDTLVQDQQTQRAATVLVATTIVAVKFAFLFFFRKILDRSSKRHIWRLWWLTIIVVTCHAPIIMFADFISCPYTGETILAKCVSPQALQRENAVFYVSVTVDLLTDSLIICIPVVILWNINLTIRKKISLAGVLCLSVFMMICAIIRVAVGNDSSGQVNTLWVLLWVELEACVAVITVSVSTFGILFTDTSHRPGPSMAQHTSSMRWPRSAGSATTLAQWRSSVSADTGRDGSLVNKSYRVDSVETQSSSISSLHYSARGEVFESKIQLHALTDVTGQEWRL